MHALAKILGSKIGTLLMSYLGMLLEASHKSLSIQNFILEKVERKLAEQKKLFLSKGWYIDTAQKYVIQSSYLFPITFNYSYSCGKYN